MAHLTPTERDTLTRTLRVFGHQAQVIQCIEELAELQVELAKWLNGRERPMQNLLLEIVDVQITLDRMRILFFEQGVVGPEVYEEMRAAKLARLEKRLEARG